MRISALAAAAGLPVATVKYYLREGLLQSGVATSATQAPSAGMDSTPAGSMGKNMARPVKAIAVHKAVQPPLRPS